MGEKTPLPESSGIPAFERGARALPSTQQPSRTSGIVCHVACLAAASLVVGLSYVAMGYYGQRQYASPVESALAHAPLTDGHNDFPIFIRAFYNNSIANITYDTRLPLQVDFPRLHSGKLRAQFWSVYVGCPDAEGDYSDSVYHSIVQNTLQQIDVVHRLIDKFPERLQPASTASDIRSIFANPAKRDAVASLLGAEGLHQIGNSPSILRLYHRLGVRYVTLTHNCHNIYADAAVSHSPPLHHGLSPVGRDMIREMNRIGMAVDLSHTSAETMRDALKASRAPIMFSHSSAFAVHPHPRNVPDDVLKLVKGNGGIVMVTFVREFVSKYPEDATLSVVADHVQHIGELIGYEHVGLGGDFDGMARGPRGLEDVSKYPDLLEELVRRGIAGKDLEGIVGANLLRVLEEVEKTAQEMADVEPLEDQADSGLFIPV